MGNDCDVFKFGLYHCGLSFRLVLCLSVCLDCWLRLCLSHLIDQQQADEVRWWSDGLYHFLTKSFNPTLWYQSHPIPQRPESHPCCTLLHSLHIPTPVAIFVTICCTPTLLLHPCYTLTAFVALSLHLLHLLHSYSSPCDYVTFCLRFLRRQSLNPGTGTWQKCILEKSRYL